MMKCLNRELVNQSNALGITALHVLSQGKIGNCWHLKPPSKMIGDPDPTFDNINISKITKKVKEKYDELINTNPIELGKIQGTDNIGVYNDRFKNIFLHMEKLIEKNIDESLNTRRY